MVSHWSTPSTDLNLTPGIVHVWRANLDIETTLLSQLSTYLNTGEQTRAQRFKFDKDRIHFIAARGILRHILSRYLAISPMDIDFNYGPYGKPYLAYETPIFFNVSHAHGYALYAFTIEQEVGIDIEFIREDFAGEEIAQRFFSIYENQKLSVIPIEQRTQAFFNCWTRKEAFIKALGDGLHFPLKDFDVSLDIPARILTIRNDPAAAEEWSLYSLQPAPNYAGTLAIKRQILAIQQWNWQV